MVRNRRGGRLLGVAALVALLVVAACPTQLTLPEITLDADGVYPGPAVTLTFAASSTDSRYSYRAVLSRSSGTDYLELGDIPVDEPVDGEGSIALDDLEDGAYRLVLTVSVARGLGSYDLQYLTRTAYFLVDSASPDPPEASVEGGSFDAAIEVFLSHPELASPAGSAVTLYYTVDGTDPTSASLEYEVGFPIPVSTDLEIRSVAVDAAGNSSAVAAWTYSFPPPAAPTITGITPATLNVDTDDDATLSIAGTAFSVNAEVSISSPGVVESVYVASASLIYAVVDVTPLSPGALAVTVSTAGGSETDNTSVTLVATAAPTISGITPATLNVDTDDNATLSIAGSDFSIGAGVSISSPGIVKSVNVVSASLIYAVVDVTPLSPGALAVTVSTAGGSDTDNTSVTLVATAAPTISGITPATLNVDTDDNATLTISGSNFSAGAGVSIGSPGIVKSVNVVSATRIYAVVDVTPLSPGALAVTVSTAGGSDTDNTSVTLVATAAPTISGITPATLNVDTDDSATLSIAGTGYTTGAGVTITAPGVVKSVDVASATLINAVVDVTGMSAGPLTVTVTTVGGSDTGSVALVASTPSITTVSPASGSVTESSLTIHISGGGFVPGGTTVVVQDSASTPATVLGVSVISSTYISLWVDLTGLAVGPGGSVVVTNPSGATDSAAFELTL